MTEWETITVPQATIISGLLTLLAAVLGVLLGWLLFGGRVKDLKSAIDASDKLLSDHKSSVGIALSDVRDKLSSFQDQFASTIEILNQLRGSVDELQDTIATPIEVLQQPRNNTSESDETNGLANGPTPTVSEPVRDAEALRDDWRAIRDRLEEQAADPSLDGRTRAKYARIDRRQYRALIDALAADRVLGADASRYRDAANIWNRYRTGRMRLSPADAEKMAELRSSLAKARSQAT